MDSLTHLLLGGAIAAAMAPARHRRAALLAGALLNTLPDLDVLPLALLDDPLAEVTWHRGPTHSLLVLPWVALALWFGLRDRVALFRDSSGRGLWLLLACLLAHPLVDAFTIYGTQLWWPLATPPAMWSSLFIIDPLFTLPLAVGCVLAWPRGERARPRAALLACLAVAALYLAWSQWAKAQVDRVAAPALAALGLAEAPRFSVPMPFTTLLWRVVALTPDGFVEGEHSLVADEGPMRFRHYRSDTTALRAVAELPGVQRLDWFTHGFMKAQNHHGRLVLSDLRMGAEPDYSFRYEVARVTPSGWQAQPVRQLRWPWEARRRLPQLWRRIWTAEEAR